MSTVAGGRRVRPGVARRGRGGDLCGVRRVLQSALRIAAACLVLLAAAYASLRLTSRPLDGAQRAQVDRALGELRRAGFAREARVLGRWAAFRSTDNWWNRHHGHADAYAATNYPFQVVTLYAPFFEQPVDDVERAAILLHEAHHLRGEDERTAYSAVWRAKHRLGWTRATHGETRVFVNVAGSTAQWAPALFRCGPGNDEDCSP